MVTSDVPAYHARSAQEPDRVLASAPHEKENRNPMPENRTDVVVLGAGIIGICVALHLQKRGRAVTLVDRRGAAEETSYGNAGLIQREGVFPYGIPHDFGALLRYGLNRTIDAH